MNGWLIEYVPDTHRYNVSRRRTKLEFWTYFNSFDTIHEALFAIKEFEIEYKRGT